MEIKIENSKKLVSEIDQKKHKSKTCYYDTCKRFPISSHTISKNYLKKLNPDLQKILTFETAVSQILTKDVKSLLKKVNQDKFSAFTGFCAFHDNNLFKKIDSFDGIVDAEKAALIHYRNICYGVHHIRSCLLECEHLSKQNYIEIDAPIESIYEINKITEIDFQTLKIRLEYCLSQHLSRKMKLEKIIKKRDFSKIKFRVLNGTISNPIFSGRSTFFLHKNHKLFSSPGYSNMPWITYMTLLTDYTNKLIFCWLKEDYIYAKSLQRLLGHNEPGKLLEILAYGHSDSFAVNEFLYETHYPEINELIEKFRIHKAHH